MTSHVGPYSQNHAEFFDHRYRIVPSFHFNIHPNFLFRRMLAITTMEADSSAGSSTANEVTIEMPTDSGPQGYHRLASLMGLVPEAAIFRRFATLNAKNLLYFEVELVWLEGQLDLTAEKDARSSNETSREHSRNWYILSQSGDESGGEPPQWKIFMRIRRTLKEYSMYHLPDSWVLSLSIVLINRLKMPLFYSRENS
jgi:hypothetical protein